MARLAGFALEPLEGTCRAGGITVKRPCYLFPSVIGKAHNREEGGFIFFMPGFLEFPLHDNVSHIAITYGYFSRPGIIYHVPSESHFRDRSWCHCHSIAPLLFRVVVFVPLYSV